MSKLAAACLSLFVFYGCGKSEDTKVIPEAIVIGCANKLRQIDSAKKRWAKQNNADPKATPTWDDLDYLFRHGPPKCPGGGTYTIGSLGEPPQCSIPAHNDYYKSNVAEEPAPAQ